jgi:pilus assembly protein CpaE
LSPQVAEKIRVLIIDDIPETRENLRKLLSFDAAITVIGAASSGQEGIELAKQYRPHVILMDINMPDMDGIQATEVILQSMPNIQVVMLSVQSEADYMRRAMLAGARDFLTKPPSVDELMNTIHRVYETGKARAASFAPVQAAAPTLPQSEGRKGKPLGEIVAVFSPKGGVGCTTVAVNLAVALKQNGDADLRVALVDGCLQFGDVGVMLNLQPSRSIADLLTEIKDLDADMLNSTMTAHGSGIKTLLAPPSPEAAESLMGTAGGDSASGPAALRAILGLLRQEYDVIVVDMWSWVDDIALTVFDAAAQIILVVTPNIPAIKSARLFLELADKLNYGKGKLSLVVNGVDPSNRISVEQIESAMMPAAGRIPLDTRAAVGAANQGAPFVMRDRNRPISQGILRLAETVLGSVAQMHEAAEAKEQEQKGKLSGLRRLRLGRIFGFSSGQQA